MPKDNVERAIKRGTGELEGVNYEEIRYEGYGIGGAAVMVDCMTDNRTRTVADVRHAFAKNGGNLGTDGSVAFLFKHCGQFVFAPGHQRGQGDGSGARGRRRGRASPTKTAVVEVIMRGPTIFRRSRQALEKAGFKPELAEITMKPTTETELTGDDAASMQKLLDALEALDDVQEVYTTRDDRHE